MKKLLLALTILGSGIANAQAWSEDFNATVPNALPAGWSQNNVDGLTVTSGLSSWNFGTNAWVSWNYTGDPHGKVAASTSWYTPAGISNDWLITPVFTVPANSVIEWEGFAVEAGYQDGYQVKISTTGTTVANFSTNLLTVSAENTTWTNRSLNLNAYSGQAVYIAFVNNSNDKNRLYLDNFKVLVPAVNDGNVVDITSLTRYMAGAGLQTIGGTFKSKGYSPANNAELNYRVNNGAVVTQVFTFGTPLNYGQTANYAFTTQANLPVGTNRIKTWVTKVNSIGETNLTNDTAYATVYVSSQGAIRSVLIEEWSSSTCAPCAALNVAGGFDALLNSNTPNSGGDVNVIKYQVNWPSPNNDPSYNAHCLARRMHYDVNAAPTTIIDGTSEMISHSQAEIDAAKLEPAFADITATLSAKGSTLASAATSVVASATIMPYLTIPSNSPLRVYQAVVQYSYTYAASSTTQDAFYHVMRKMSPDAWGTPLNVTSGTPIVVNFSLNTNAGTLDPSTPVQNSYSVWVNSAVGPKAPKDIVYEYVVFVQDTISNDVIQSGSWTSTVTVPANTVSTVGMKELTNTNQIEVFPNPAKDFATISIAVEKSTLVDVTIYDVTGKIVFINKGANIDAGKNEMKISTTELAAGNYNIIVNANGTVLKEKLIIVK